MYKTLTMTLKNGGIDTFDYEPTGAEFENYTEWLNAKIEDINASKLCFVNEQGQILKMDYINELTGKEDKEII